MSGQISFALKALKNKQPILIIHQAYAESERYGMLIPYRA